MKNFTFLYLVILLCFFNTLKAQDITLFQQFNGRYDYTAIGNTLNPAENNLDNSFCTLPTSASANLNLPNNVNIIAAYLFWSGSGNGDTQVSLNNITINAQDTYNVNYDAGSNGQLTYFACYADVTNQIINEGSTTYNLSNLDVNSDLINTPGFCNNRTNYAGWSLYVIYEDNNLPLNQINLFQGLEIINSEVQEKTIILDNINVLDNDNAKIGFLAWEGDNALNYGESLSINGNILSNPPLNLPDNAFNGTNTFTNSTNFYNADLDVYNIENNISIGDTQVTIKMTTGGVDQFGIFRADLIILNNIITVLNSQLPDATIAINNYDVFCANREIDINYTVYNTNSTDILPVNTPISFYIDNLLIGQTTTQNNIAINASENNQTTLTIPPNYPDNFILEIVVDDNGSGNGIVTETNENNNNTFQTIQLIPLPETILLNPISACNQGKKKANFDLTQVFSQINEIEYNSFSFFESLEDINEDYPILSPANYASNSTPQTIYITAETEECFDIFQFELQTENCPPFVPQGFSPNGDSKNDFFNIQGLYDIFENHELLIYNRYGKLIFKGNNNLKWHGQSNQGILAFSDVVPTGTYFYVLKLHDPKYDDLVGWVYLNK
ncbi:MAG: gliding motility-associated C-terminal domain-containing protein [Mesoflavibacter sp.]|nr:gliding motility-associated C-terminal domain-containing protein [Mesoflavibacter sp.]